MPSHISISNNHYGYYIDRTNNAKNYIMRNIEKNISYETLSSLCSMSYPTFSRVFVKENGCTVEEFIQNARVSLAKLALLSSQENIPVISEKSGFASASDFKEIFMRETGYSPLQYRQLHG